MSVHSWLFKSKEFPLSSTTQIQLIATFSEKVFNSYHMIFPSLLNPKASTVIEHKSSFNLPRTTYINPLAELI